MTWKPVILILVWISLTYILFFESEVQCTAFYMKKSFVCFTMKIHFHNSETIQKWPVAVVLGCCCFWSFVHSFLMLFGRWLVFVAHFIIQKWCWFYNRHHNFWDLLTVFSEMLKRGTLAHYLLTETNVQIYRKCILRQLCFLFLSGLEEPFSDIRDWFPCFQSSVHEFIYIELKLEQMTCDIFIQLLVINFSKQN